jgi:hypothetical protein
MKNETNEVMDGAQIAVTVHYVGADGIGRRYRTLWRRATRYQRHGNRETVLVRIHRNAVWAERYPNTVWTVALSEVIANG